MGLINKIPRCKMTQEEMDEKYNRTASNHPPVTTAIYEMYDLIESVNKDNAVTESGVALNALRRLASVGSIVTPVPVIGLPVKIAEEIVNSKQSSAAIEAFYATLDKEMFAVNESLRDARRSHHETITLMKYQQSLRDAKAISTAYLKKVSEEEASAVTEGTLITNLNQLPVMERFTAMERSDFKTDDEYDAALMECFRCMLHMQPLDVPCKCCDDKSASSIAEMPDNEPDVTIDLEARKSALIRSDSIIMKRIMNDKGLFNSVDKSCGNAGKSCFTNGDCDCLNLFNFDIHKVSKVKNENEVAVKNFNKKLEEAAVFANKRLSDTEYEVRMEGAWDTPSLVLAYKGVVTESVSEHYKSFDEFCDANNDILNVMEWLDKSHIKSPKANKKGRNILWPDDVIRTRTASCTEIALFVHYWAENKGIENYIGCCTFIGIKNKQYSELVSMYMAIIKRPEENEYCMFVFTPGSHYVCRGFKTPEAAIESFGENLEKGVSSAYNMPVIPVTSVMTSREISYFDEMYNKPYPIAKYLADESHFRTHVNAIFRATDNDDLVTTDFFGDVTYSIIDAIKRAKKFIVGESYNQVATEGIVQTAQDIVRKGVNTARKIAPDENPVNSVDRVTEPLDNMVNNAIDGFKNAMKSDTRDEIIEGKTRIKLTRVIAKCIAYGGLAVLTHPAIAAIAFLGKMAYDKNLDSKERGKIINDLRSELEIVKEKIKDAENKGDNENKYKLMRIQNQLERQIARITYKNDDI